MAEAGESLLQEPQAAERTSLRELAILFLRLGTTAFGGPAAHIALVEDEVVRRRRWLTHEELLDLLGAVNLIPGPNSTEMAIHIGYLRGGWLGLIVAGMCFILPAMILVIAIAVAYEHFGGLPQFEGLLYGVKPVVIAIVIQAIWGLGRTAIKTAVLAVVAALVAVAGFFEVDVLLAILVAGVVVGLGQGWSKERKRIWPVLMMLFIAGAIFTISYLAARSGTAAQAEVGLKPLFLYFLKAGSVLYGSGYVLLAYLQADLVSRAGARHSP
jgi:chromate transporter